MLHSNFQSWQMRSLPTLDPYRILILVVVQMLARARKWLGVDKKMEGEILTIPKVPNRKLFENAQITSIKGHVTSS